MRLSNSSFQVIADEILRNSTEKTECSLMKCDKGFLGLGTKQTQRRSKSLREERVQQALYAFSDHCDRQESLEQSQLLLFLQVCKLFSTSRAEALADVCELHAKMLCKTH